MSKNRTRKSKGSRSQDRADLFDEMFEQVRSFGITPVTFWEGVFSASVRDMAMVCGEWVLGLGRFKELRPARSLQGVPEWPHPELLFVEDHTLNNGMGMKVSVRRDPGGSRGLLLEFIHRAELGHPLVEGHYSISHPNRAKLEAIHAKQSEFETLPFILIHRILLRPTTNATDARISTPSTSLKYALVTKPVTPEALGWWRPCPWLPELLPVMETTFGPASGLHDATTKALHGFLANHNWDGFSEALIARMLPTEEKIGVGPILLARGAWADEPGTGFRGEKNVTKLGVIESILHNTIPCYRVPDMAWTAVVEALQGRYGRKDGVVHAMRQSENELALLSMRPEGNDLPDLSGAFWGETLPDPYFADALERIGGVAAQHTGTAISPEFWEEADPEAQQYQEIEIFKARSKESLDTLEALFRRAKTEAEEAQGKRQRAENLLAKAEDEKESATRITQSYKTRCEEADSSLKTAKSVLEKALSTAAAQEERLQEEIQRLQNALRVASTTHDVAAMVEMTQEQAESIRRLEEALCSSKEQNDELQQEGRTLKARLLAYEQQVADLTSRPTSGGAQSSEGRAEFIKAALSGQPTLEEALRFFQDAFPERLTVLESALRSAKESVGFEYPARAFDLLKRFTVDYYEAMAAGQGDAKAREVFGKDGYAANESETVETNARAQALRTFTYRGKSVVMNKHLKIGYRPGSSETLRIHFHWDAEAKKLVIGWAGSHLDHK